MKMTAKRFRTQGLLATAVAALFSMPAGASTVTDNFSFTDSSSNVLAYGSFSYDSSSIGQLTYADLSAFTVHLIGENQTYGLPFANSATDYKYFGYNTTSNTFEPGVSSGYGGPYTGILSAMNGASSGFFFDPLPSQSPPNNDGIFSGYPSGTYYYATAVTITPVPEAGTYAMMLAGLGLVGFMARRRIKL